MLLLGLGVLMLVLIVFGITYVANNYGRCSNDRIIFISCMILTIPICMMFIVLRYIL